MLFGMMCQKGERGGQSLLKFYGMCGGGDLPLGCEFIVCFGKFHRKYKNNKKESSA